MLAVISLTLVLTNTFLPRPAPLCGLLRIILTVNNFTFYQHHYLHRLRWLHHLQIFSVLGIIETNALSNAPFHPHTWWRYLEDIFMIWTEGLDHLKILKYSSIISMIFTWTWTWTMNFIIHPTIKFTSNHSLTNIHLSRRHGISIYNGTIETHLCTKPIDKTDASVHLAILNKLKRLSHLAELFASTVFLLLTLNSHFAFTRLCSHFPWLRF